MALPSRAASGDGLGLSPVQRTASRARASDLVFHQLEAAIRDLRLIPGLGLSESRLTEEFEVSRTPVREALARLADVGLVQVLPQVGTRVARIRPADIREAQFVREHLECGAFEAVCSREEVSLLGLRELLHDQVLAYRSGDEELFFACDEALHRAIFDVARLPGAWEVVEGAKLQLDRLRRLTLPEPTTTAELIDEHAQIVDALERRDVEGGRAIIRSHSRRALIQLPRLREEYPEYFTDD